MFHRFICLSTNIEFSAPHILDVQKQSDLLLNADDLDAMWVCLRENCVIDDATGAEKVIYFWLDIFGNMPHKLTSATFLELKFI